MRAKNIVFVALFLFSYSLFSQNVCLLSFRDATTNRLITHAKIVLPDGQTFYADSGSYVWQSESISQITITAWNYKDTTLLYSIINGRDSLSVYLSLQPEQLSEVLVNPENSWLSRHIVGFEHWQRGWVFLLTKDLVVTSEKLDVLYQAPVPELDIKIPKEISSDPFQNLYLVGLDSVKQIYITDTLTYIYPSKSKLAFDYLIGPLLLETSSGLIYREVKEVDYNVDYLMRQTGSYFALNLKYPVLHNCGILLNLKTDGKSVPIYTAMDTNAYKAASIAFANYISAYIKFWQKHENDGVFDPQLKSAYGAALHSYKHLFAQYKETYFQRYRNKYILFDPYSKQLVTFNQKLEVVKKQPFDFTDCPREEYLYIDQATGKWWLQRRIRGLDVLESARPGDPPQQITLDPFVRNIRVHNNTVFYINERDEFRVKKIEPKNN